MEAVCRGLHSSPMRRFGGEVVPAGLSALGSREACRGQRVHSPVPPGVLKDGSCDPAPLTKPCRRYKPYPFSRPSMRVRLSTVN